MTRTASRGSMKQRGMSGSARLSPRGMAGNDANATGGVGRQSGAGGGMRRRRRGHRRRCRTMRASLWGADHEQLDDIASAAAGPRAGLAITRGRFPKAYRYEDPNEDVVAAVSGPRATLLICADGHNGVTASHLAVRRVLDAI